MIDTKNFIFICVVVFVAMLIGIYIPYKLSSRNYSEPQEVASTTIPSVTVTYTNKGFEPNIVEIKHGDTVEWLNTSDKLMWVASDPHPSHTDLPGFDERGVYSDQTKHFIPVAYAHSKVTRYKYTFLKVGSWHYHNHLIPNDRGVVIAK